MQRGAQHPRQHPCVVQRVVGLELRHAVVLGECAEPQVVGRRVDAPVQRQGAQPPGHGQAQPRPRELVGEEVVVELGVVGDQHPALQERADALRHLLEDRRPAQPPGRQPVHVHRPRIAARVEQGRELPGLPAVRTQGHHGQGQHPVAARYETGGLHVDQRPFEGVVAQVGQIGGGGRERHEGRMEACSHLLQLG